MKRTGRPAVGVAPATALITQRVRLLIDGAHIGNVHEASKVSGVPSATLRALYSGKNVNPELKTLETLARQYGVLPGWFSDPNPLGYVPPTGIDISLRVMMPNGERYQEGWLFIPWASWPLPDVFNRLVTNVVNWSPRGKHPIIEGLGLDPTSPTDIYEVRAAIAKFLLAPLLSAQPIAKQKLPEQRTRLDAVMVRRMRMLGMFWQDALGIAITPK